MEALYSDAAWPTKLGLALRAAERHIFLNERDQFSRHRRRQSAQGFS
jgi:hypothetical protein